MWSDRTVRLLLAVGLLFASGLVLVLARQNRAHRAAYAELYRRTSRLVPGVYVPTFAATALDGRSLTVGEAANGRRQVVFVFNTTCRFCYASLPAWKTIAARLDSAGHAGSTVIGISLDSADVTGRYIAANDLRFPVVRFPAPKLAPLYRALSVPQSYVLDESGRVVYAHTGLLNNPAIIDSIVDAVRVGEADSVPSSAGDAPIGLRN